MTTRSVHHPRRRLPLSIVIWAGLAVAPTPALAQHACSALTQAQVATMLGPAPTSKEFGAGMMCNWTATTGPRKLQVTIAPLTNEVRAHFNERWNRPGRNGMADVRREPGLGDRAVSFTLPYGVNFQVVKGAHILTLVYANHGVAPAARDHDALRALAVLVLRGM
jgi:hypothetical protein